MRSARTGVGLAHRQCTDLLAGNQFRQIALLLPRVAIAANLVHTQIRMRAVRQSDRGRGAADLLHGNDVRKVAHAGAAELFPGGDAEHAEPAQLTPEVGRKIVAAVDVRGTRRDFPRGEFCDRLAQLGDVRAETKIKR